MTTRIMVVDDEPAIGTLLLYQLQNLGYEAVYVQDGMQALQRVLIEQPDLILLDVMMPQLNGWEVCREIRSCSDVPIIMVTGKDANDDVVAGLSVGADDYVTKPFVMSQLQARVEAVLRRSRGSTKHHHMGVQSSPRRHDYAVAPVAAEAARPLYVSEPSRAVRPMVAPVALATTEGSISSGLLGQGQSILPTGLTETASLPQKQRAAEHDSIVPVQLGSRLRQTRQERSISLYQAERLCQARWDILQAIEQENWDYAPRPQMRAALASYAHLLKIDLEPYQKHQRHWFDSMLAHQTLLGIVLVVALIVAIVLMMW